MEAARSNKTFSEPVETTDAKMIGRICRFRVQVWREAGQLAADAFPEGIWQDEIDQACKHWVVLCGDEIVGAVRWSLHESLHEVSEAEQYVRHGLRLDGPIAMPARVVVAGGAQHKGLARILLDLQDQASLTGGARHAVRQASPAMARLLTQRDWQIVGPADSDPRFPGVVFQVAVRKFVDSQIP